MRYLLDMLELVGDISTYIIDTPIELLFEKSGGGILKIIGDSAIFIITIDSSGYQSGRTVPKELGMANLMPKDLQIESILNLSILHYETFDDIKSEY